MSPVRRSSSPRTSPRTSPARRSTSPAARTPPAAEECLARFGALREAAFIPPLDAKLEDSLQRAGVRLYRHALEGYWGQSVAEFALALTLCALRRIPQTHHEILTSQAPWRYTPE